MWTTIFYSLGIYFLFKEIGVFTNPKREWGINHFRNNYDSLFADANGDPELEEVAKRIRYQGAMQTLIFHLPYTLWSMVGLFSSQWVLFAALFLLRALTTKLLKVYEYPSNQLSIIRGDSFISILLITFIVLNHFQ